jgi:hypothetical protein
MRAFFARRPVRLAAIALVVLIGLWLAVRPSASVESALVGVISVSP